MAARTDRAGSPDPDEAEWDSLWVMTGVPRGYRNERASHLFPVTHDQFLACRNANVRGTANPSIMNNPFWLLQVGIEGTPGWNAREYFGNGENPWLDGNHPVWCFDRFGATTTRLPDRRLVCIGGEHGDYDDPDFCIYNDVVVYDAPQKTYPPPLVTPECIKIYGYPLHVFPPTDWHTSTYYKDPWTDKEMIFIIGGIGYRSQISRVRTEIHKLDLSDFSIHRVETSGPGPTGPTHLHHAGLFVENGYTVIKIRTTPAEIHPPDDEMAVGGESTANGGNHGTLVADYNGGSGTITRYGQMPVRTQASEFFSLRIRDMTWV